jgi:hypothetical protein
MPTVVVADYLHTPVTGDAAIARANREAVRLANDRGFVVNLSADNLSEADELAALNVGAVVVVLDAEEGQRHDVTTPAGRKVATCPATYRDNVTCQSCGLCQHQDRKANHRLSRTWQRSAVGSRCREVTVTDALIAAVHMGCGAIIAGLVVSAIVIFNGR